jgi:RHS repeat-associated protein
LGCKKLTYYQNTELRIVSNRKELTSNKSVLKERRAYLYGFQGQERDNEFKGDGNSVNYKYRVHDPRLGRFLSIDPLAPKYAHNSPYAFSENIVINAIELEGLEAFFVTGTTSTNKRWAYPNDQTKRDETLIKGLMKYTRNSVFDDNFNWNREVFSGKYDGEGYPKMRSLNYIKNDQNDRKSAAMDLAKHIMDVRLTRGIDFIDENGNRVYGKEPITLIAHSHGGNVAIQAATMLYGKHGLSIDLITISTPTYKGTAEDPANNPGIRSHLAIFNNIDGVAGGAAGGGNYNWSSKTSNVFIDASGYYSAWNMVGAHSFDNNYMDGFLDRLHQAFVTQGK